MFVSDSSFAGIRWSGALEWLQGAQFDNRLESCRRLIGSSCRGREGYAPRTANDELASLPAGAFDTAVIATGYNDWSGLFPIGLDAVITTARRKGIERVVWMTYRENVGYEAPAGAATSSTFVRNNLTLNAAVASGRYPELVARGLADVQPDANRSGSPPMVSTSRSPGHALRRSTRRGSSRRCIVGRARQGSAAP